MMKWYRCLLFSVGLSVFFLDVQATVIVVHDIQVEGLQSISAGTVLSYIPVQVGSTITEKDYPGIIHALFKTGFFSDVKLEHRRNSLVVVVVERPTISEIKIFGNKDVSTDDIKKTMTSIGLSEGQFFDSALLEKLEQELLQKYYSQGKYGVKVKSNLQELERNRVAITISILESKVSRITQINIVGNKAFSDKELMKHLQLSPTSIFSFFTKDDQYSKQKLEADLESLRSFYLDRGYLKFKVESTHVSITPDKRGVYITVNMIEGTPYTVHDVQLSGKLDLLHERELRKLLAIEAGEIFSRAKMTEVAKKMRDLLGAEGYLFADINALPKVDDENKQVALTFLVDLGKRVYVRRINIQGNIKTEDEVLRRELRQMEGSLVSTKDLDRSKEHLQRLDYLERVEVELLPVPGTNDQVDVNYTVVERSSGSVTLGLGYGQESGLLLNVSLFQNNFLGTGNLLGIMFNNSDIGKNYSFSFNNPYYTLDGVSLGFKLYYRDINSSELNTANYIKNSFGSHFNLGFPLNEFDTLRLSPGYEHIWIDTTKGTPYKIFDYLDQNGDSYDQIKLDTSWAHDTRDRVIFPTSGGLSQVSVEAAIPGVSKTEFYKLNYRGVNYLRLSRWVICSISGEIGYGDGYGSADSLPFFENFYAGGLKSVRGFKSNTLGPRYDNGDPSGGAFKMVASAQAILPVPFITDTENVRIATFFDTGNVFQTVDDLDVQQLRYSVGVSGLWMSPFGPIVLSIALPLNAKPGDKEENFQFSFGLPFN